MWIFRSTLNSYHIMRLLIPYMYKSGLTEMFALVFELWILMLDEIWWLRLKHSTARGLVGAKGASLTKSGANEMIMQGDVFKKKGR